jgi:predicted permease
MSTLLQDLRYALRMLRKSPGFTTVAVLTLALGIGANTAIFIVVNAVLLRPLPYPDPDRVVQFVLENPKIGALSIPMFMFWREQRQVLQDFAMYDIENGPGLNLTDGDHPERLRGIHVSADYFRLFGTPVEIGRTFTAREDSPGAPRPVVISDGLWRRRFGADQSLVGKAILLGGEPPVVIGVLGPSFGTDPPTDIWLPIQADPNSTDESVPYHAVARLKSGVTLQRAKAQMKLAETRYQQTFQASQASGQSWDLEPLHDAVIGDVRLTLLVLLGAVSFVLLIACANVANLLLARATGRRREIAIRAALGAGRRRIVSQLAAESLLLSLGGGILGLVLGYASMRALLVLNPGDIPRIGAHGSAVTLDWRVLAFTLLTAVLTGILFGLLPAVRASREDFGAALKESGARSGAGLGQSKARSTLVVAEISASLILLAGAALLIRTLMALRAVDPGFDTHNVLTLEMSLAEARFDKSLAVAQLVREAQRRVRGIAGVQALATTYSLPLDPQPSFAPFIIEGRPLAKDRYHGWALDRPVSAGYFEVFRVPLRRGRMFTERDDGRALASYLSTRRWPGSSGRRATLSRAAITLLASLPISKRRLSKLLVRHSTSSPNAIGVQTVSFGAST